MGEIVFLLRSKQISQEEITSCKLKTREREEEEEERRSPRRKFKMMMNTKLNTKCVSSARVVGGQRVRSVSRATMASRRFTSLNASRQAVACSAVNRAQSLSLSTFSGSALRLSQSRRERSVVGRGLELVVRAAKRSVGDLSEADLKGKKVFVRADLNVPLDGEQNITDDTRIRAAVPTLKYLLEKGAKVLLTSHLGRPKDGPEDKFRLNPVVPRLTELLGQEVGKADDCIGDEVAAKVDAMSDGEILILENVRFYKEETKNEGSFAEKLAANADLYVNDAFGTAHRAHASTEGVTKYLSPSVSGFLLQKELDYLDGAISEPKRPFCAIVGGSLVEEDKVELAKELEKKAAEKVVEFLLPSDVVVADKFAPDAATQTVSIDAIPDGWMGLDIGPDSLKQFQNALSDCQTVVWNGPMGVFEFDAFAAGTVGIADTLAELSGKGCTTIIGGGDSVAAVEKAGVAEKMSHISTGGGASLELLEGKVLPGVAALDEAVAVSA